MHLDKDWDDLPTLRSSKLRLFSILEDENADIRDVERIIESDPAMSAKMVRLANSAFYRHAKPSRTIHDAIVTIGFDMVRCIALSMSVMQTFNSKDTVAQSLWRHSSAVALTALGMGKTRDERGCLFSGGLLHDLGRVVLIWKEPTTYATLFKHTWPDLEQERTVFETDHTRLGEEVAQRWHFPADVIDVIRHHHAPTSRPSAVVCLVDLIVHQEENGHQTAAPID
ncbi:MAG TPA: HDOD domain-containing protein, partial [Deltaproteobacteria bacterium]|nr:HDOD domain-containing protein [Deltaproteobacteria bacterium]